MKIAIIVRGFPNIVQTYILNQVTSIIKAGYQVTIIAVFHPKQTETHPDVDNYQLLDNTVYINTDKSKLLNQLFNAPLYKPSYLALISRIIFSNLWKKYGPIYWLKAMIKTQALSFRRFDIAHSHSLFSTYEYLFLKDIFNIPVITTFHGLEPKNAQPLSYDKLKKVLENGDAFILNTQFAKKQLVSLGCDEGKIHIIPQGTNIDEFPFIPREIMDHKPITLLSVGRLSIEKGFHIVISAVAELKLEYPEICYHIIGSGAEAKNLSKQIGQCGLHDQIKIFGSVSTDELRSHYANAHVFILPSIDFKDGSHTETQGVVLQEAQASGIPVIASQTGGIPEVINDGETGLLFEEKDVMQLTYKIKSLISDKKLYRSLQKQARKDVEDNYSIDTICKKLTKVYKDTLSNF